VDFVFKMQKVCPPSSFIKTWYVHFQPIRQHHLAAHAPTQIDDTAVWIYRVLIIKTI